MIIDAAKFAGFEHFCGFPVRMKVVCLRVYTAYGDSPRGICDLLRLVCLHREYIGEVTRGPDRSPAVSSPSIIQHRQREPNKGAGRSVLSGICGLQLPI